MDLIVPRPIKNILASSIVSWGYTFVFKTFLKKLQKGCIMVEINDPEYPQYNTNSKPLVYGNRDTGATSKMNIINLYRFLTKIMFGGDIGFSETFILGDFTTDNLSTLLKIFIYNRSEMDELDSKYAFVKHGIDRLYHFFKSNTISGARDNIRAHYDLSNDMFQLFLDPTMSYSSAIFEHPEQDLESAQLNKIRKLIDKAQLEPHHHLLEIGSGWGALAMEAVRRTGCRVTTISLSIEQVNLAKLRIKQAGLSDRINVELVDYRHLQGQQFDRIISCEMIEAVGHDHLHEYFGSIESLLKPNGIVVIQYIATIDQRYEQYLKSCDFIQKYIFPGSLCPTTTALITSITQNTKLIVDHLENFAPHYAKTLQTWCQNFVANQDKILSVTGFGDQFVRMFIYYFSYCEAAFGTRTIGLFQMTLTRPCNTDLPNFYANQFTSTSNPSNNGRVC